LPNHPQRLYVLDQQLHHERILAAAPDIAFDAALQSVTK